MSQRIATLAARLRKGGRRTEEILSSLTGEQWQMMLYEDPHPWTVRDVVAHLFSAEEALLQGARNIAAGRAGAPEGFDYHAYNASEHTRLADVPPDKLLADLKAARQSTIAWVETLDEAKLDNQGHHPALGEITLEDFVNAMHGHQLMHMRDLRALLRS
jgi:hypothetical protein